MSGKAFEPSRPVLRWLLGDQASIPVLKDAKHLVPGPEFGQFGVQTIVVAAHHLLQRHLVAPAQELRANSWSAPKLLPLRGAALSHDGRMKPKDRAQAPPANPRKDQRPLAPRALPQAESARPRRFDDVF